MDTKNEQPEYYIKVQDGEYKTSDSMQELMKGINLRWLAQKVAGFLSPSVFHQRINQYLLNGHRATFTYSTLLSFYEALAKYVIQLNTLLNSTKDVLDKMEPYQNKQLYPTPKEEKTVTIRIIPEEETV